MENLDYVLTRLDTKSLPCSHSSMTWTDIPSELR